MPSCTRTWPHGSTTRGTLGINTQTQTHTYTAVNATNKALYFYISGFLIYFSFLSYFFPIPLLSISFFFLDVCAPYFKEVRLHSIGCITSCHLESTSNNKAENSHVHIFIVNAYTFHRVNVRLPRPSRVSTWDIIPWSRKSWEPILNCEAPVMAHWRMEENKKCY